MNKTRRSFAKLSKWHYSPVPPHPLLSPALLSRSLTLYQALSLTHKPQIKYECWAYTVHWSGRVVSVSSRLLEARGVGG